MRKYELKDLTQGLIRLIAENPKEAQNLVEWAESYLDCIEIRKADKQLCQWCEKDSARLIYDTQEPNHNPDLICKKCFLINLYEYLEAMKDVVYP